MVLAPPFLHDNVLRELRRNVEAQGCSFVVFSADPEVKHQIEEFAETSGGEALVGLSFVNAEHLAVLDGFSPSPQKDTRVAESFAASLSTTRRSIISPCPS